MPTYEYRCGTCGYNFEVQQRFEDEPISTCPPCDEAVRKVFKSVGIVFKGSGFYSTDSASKPTETPPEATNTATPSTSETTTET